MIRKVIVRRFKRFGKVEVDLPGHIVLAGPNNSGKTTLLQAIAAWSLAFDRWKQLNDFQRHGGAYTKAPIARQAFSAVPLRAFDLLWNQRKYSGSVEIEIHTDKWQIPMELIADSTEQIYVRPKPAAPPATLREAEVRVAYVPPMSGLSTDEPEYKSSKKIDQLLGQGRPGEVIRNLLVAAHNSDAWTPLQQSIRRLFDYELLPPDASGADIIAEYKAGATAPRLDIASAGSGFQQVLMLLTFLHTRPASVLLLDEPDAHLHVILQDTIYSELRSAAAAQKSQLIIATHSEVIINSVDPMQLCALFHQPKLLTNATERQKLSESLGVLTNTDVMVALAAPGVLYVEDYTDINILREWARILKHPVYDALNTKIMVRKTVAQNRPDGSGIKAKDHYEALKQIRDNLPGIELVDGDTHQSIQSTALAEGKLQRLRWKRYEIESYLFHPAVLTRYVRKVIGDDAAQIHEDDLQKYLVDNYPPAFIREPLGDSPFLVGTKARTVLLPPALTAAGLPGADYRDFYEIAAVMKPEEIHPEVIEKLDAIQQAFGL